MSTADDEQGAERDRTAAGEPAARTRRAWLGGVAGGLTLAASGLLRDWLVEEAEADNHPVRRVQGRKDQRRSKQRHERDKRRRHHDKHKGESKQHTPGSKGFNGIEFSVEIEGYRSVKVSFYTTGAGGEWGLAKSKTIGPAESATFADRFSPCALWIDDRFWVEASNPTLDYPTAKVGYGGSVSTTGWKGGRTLFDEKVREGDSFHPSLIDGFGIEVARLTDNPNKVFKVVAEAPPA